MTKYLVLTYGCTESTFGIKYYFTPMYGPDVLIPFEPQTLLPSSAANGGDSK